MFSNIENKFKKIGAKVNFLAQYSEISADASPVRLNVVTRKGEELFEVAVRLQDPASFDLSVLEVRPEDRHLVLLARRLDDDGNVVAKDHYLCGHDERHLFVALVKPSTTVAAAKASLKPQEILEKEQGLNTSKRNRRRNKNFVRQGEWFFIPAPELKPEQSRIRKNEPLSRGLGSKSHIAQFAHRAGGELVMVCREHPRGLTLLEYKELLSTNQRASYLNWTQMVRNASVYVKGTVRHPDHATITLDGWHRVLMNTERMERREEAIAFLD